MGGLHEDRLKVLGVSFGEVPRGEGVGGRQVCGGVAILG